MIVEMHRVLVFGPKRLLGEVVEEVQRIGVLHIDRIEAEEASLRTLDLDEATAAEVGRLEQLRARADGLLGLLPSVETGGATRSAEDLSDAPTDTLEAAVGEIEGEVQALSRRRLEAEEELELIRTYESAVRVLSPLLGALSGSRSLETIGFILRGKDLSVVAALHNQLRELTEGRVEVVSRTIEEGKIGVVVAFLRRDAEAVRGFLTRAGISELRLPARYAEYGPAEAVRLMEQRRSELPGELAAIAAHLADLARRHRPRLAAVRAAVADRLARLQATANLAQSRYTFILHGWAPAARVLEVRGMLRARFGRDVVVHHFPADPHEAARVPVLLDNPAPIRPFQRMLGLFKPPRYGTMDPTIFLAIFFPIFAGIVIGDVAYGALLFAFGWWMRNKARRGETWEVAVGPVKLGMRLGPATLADASWIIRVLATWVVIFGVLYLEVFGNLLEHHLGWHPIFNRVQLTTAFLGLVLALGLTQVMLGYVLHLVQAARHRHAFGVVESLAMICGVAGLILLLGAMGDQLPRSVLTPGVALLAAFLVFFLLGFAINRFAAFWLIEAISGMGHVFSYARLFGVGLAAAVLANVSNELGGRFGPVWVGILVGVLIQMIFFLFTLPGHVIQPARLNWVEFLTKVKYHDETGNSYRPLQKTGGD
ncbi:MAG: V-type ATPase 116kDa subunit family protein [Armatimonadota bacterium]|nr:V-type ATPase 116kDa subunit family protein [Armatimonadota bacterium]MDR7519930.1 V-type ATPase 116kDa subunit family protein [Armatimonadota bacterium]